MITSDTPSGITHPRSRKQNGITTSMTWNSWPLSKRSEIGVHSWQDPHTSSRYSQIMPTYSTGDNPIKSAAESLEKSRNSPNIMSYYDTFQGKQTVEPTPYLDVPITIKGTRITRMSQSFPIKCSFVL